MNTTGAYPNDRNLFAVVPDSEPVKHSHPRHVHAGHSPDPEENLALGWYFVDECEFPNGPFATYEEVREAYRGYAP